VVRVTGVKIILIDVESRADLETAFEAIKQSRIGGVLVQADDLFINEGARIVELAATYRIPAIYRLGSQAEAGGLMAYGPNVPDMYRRAAFYVHKILKGAKPAELPVEQPRRIDLVINLKTAKALGLNLPLTLQAAADEVIE
jgi:putative ABC transport system substrate-binding protein